MVIPDSCSGGCVWFARGSKKSLRFRSVWSPLVSEPPACPLLGMSASAGLHIPLLGFVLLVVRVGLCRATCEVFSWLAATFSSNVKLLFEAFHLLTVIYFVQTSIHYFLKILGSFSVLAFSQAEVIKMMSKRNYKWKLYPKLPDEWVIPPNSSSQNRSFCSNLSDDTLHISDNTIFSWEYFWMH